MNELWYPVTSVALVLTTVFILQIDALATETRVGSMGGVGFYIRDNSNVFVFPLIVLLNKIKRREWYRNITFGEPLIKYPHKIQIFCGDIIIMEFFQQTGNLDKTMMCVPRWGYYEGINWKNCFCEFNGKFPVISRIFFQILL